MMKNKAGLVALVVLAVATLLMVFLVLPNLGRDSAGSRAPASSATTAETAPQPATPQPAPAPASPSSVSSSPAETTTAADAKQPRVPDAAASAPSPAPDSAPAPDKPVATDQPAAPDNAAAPAQAATGDTAQADIPSFDVLRVERDGSTVIAGRAAPGSDLAVVNGDTVITTTKVSPSGDFAAVLDQPLAPGDYQLTLRATGKDGKDKSSNEVATVSVPKTPDGELLAMVSKPGEASRIITAPGEAADVPPAPAIAAPPPAAEAAAQPAAALPAPAMRIAVTAVEIEGSRIFVAGTAPAGALVRAYADNTFIGEAKAGANGRFVIDGQIDLSVGSHIIRADLIGPDGVKVTMRASVPFERPAGAQVAAVAQPTADAAASEADAQLLDMARGQVRKAFALLKGLFASDQTPQADTLAAARSATEIALGSLSGLKADPTSSATTRERMQISAKAAGKALAVLKPVAREAAAVKAVLSQVEAALAPVLHDEPAMAAVPPAGVDSAAAGGQAAPAPQTAPPETAAAEPPTVQQAPLQQSRNSVIIRRGDTLWQISRRVYGAGVRYTTIYVANEDQINDPDRILPGQVFGVPDKALPDPESEAIHRRHMQQMQRN
ncbi:hypothetical protein BJF92_02200 [Rhizobium rhizosphaerae]|uniref:LysM domain-containing protein n=1 Tax=Xaviernesmea rhizosphaerae TaxID=1672749 RepID=A0A1Q9AKV4_9HYPH|nr:hypothetical protein BJF92_02200 [Xaviernesmea rhizosphaerae]